MTLQKVPRREAIIIWEQNHSPLRFYDITRNKTYAEVTVDNTSTTTQTQGSGRGASRIPISNPGNARGGGTGRGRGSRSQSNQPSSRNFASSSSTYGNSQSHYSPSISQFNRFAPLDNETTQNNQPEPMDSSFNSKKRNLSNSSTNSNTNSNPPPKAPKSKLNRTFPKHKPLLNNPMNQKEVDGVTYFLGSRSTFSNFHYLGPKGRILVDIPNGFKPPDQDIDNTNNKLIFKTTEHLYQFRKAWYFGDKNTAMRIYKSNIAKDAKDLGKRFKEKDEEWHRVAVDVMCECQYRKYTLTPLRKIIQEATAKFVELTSHDAFWGSGSDYIEESKGDNYMGRILQSLRLYLLGQAPDSDEFKSTFDKIKNQIADNPSSFNVVQK